MANPNYIFVVDDDPSARKGIARLLRTANYDVREFASVNEFLDALNTDSPGCVVIEAGMPGISTEKSQEELEACGAELPIIVISADDDPETRRIAKKMKAAGFFRKPVDGTALLDAIDWALRSSTLPVDDFTD